MFLANFCLQSSQVFQSYVVKSNDINQFQALGLLSIITLSVNFTKHEVSARNKVKLLSLPPQGLRHKSESEPALETRRSPTPPCSLTGRQWSRDSSPDCPPRQMAPIPDVAGDSHHGNGHQGSPPSLDRSSRDSSPENDDGKTQFT